MYLQLWLNVTNDWFETLTIGFYPDGKSNFSKRNPEDLAIVSKKGGLK